MNDKLAYEVTVGVAPYGPGASVTGMFQCATEEKARELEALLKTLAKDDKPDWSKE